MCNRRYNSLSDFLISNPLSVDEQVDDGAGEFFSLKGREIEATILFADVTGFSRRTEDFNPIETLIFLNYFLCWVTAEGIRKHGGIVDKYIGDEVMVVFSKEFGSLDPFADALRTATAMAQFDPLCFRPHFGLASGKVIVGFTGSTLAYSVSVFGFPVAMAALCAKYKEGGTVRDGTITFPADLWTNRPVEELLAPQRQCARHNPESVPQPESWTVSESYLYSPENMSPIMVKQLVSPGLWFTGESADQKSLNLYRELWGMGRIRGGSRPKESKAKDAGVEGMGFLDENEAPSSDNQGQ